MGKYHSEHINIYGAKSYINTLVKFIGEHLNRKSKIGIRHSESRERMFAPTQKSTTVVDVTYFCNATCIYCQWGNPDNPLRKPLPLQEILLSAETIKALGTERIVLSGGEPRLHPQLLEVLSHYRRLVNEVVIMTNGYGLDRQEVSRLTEHGATGVTVSLDSTLPGQSMLTRETSSDIHRQIVFNLKDICEHPREFELGINSVVSHVTANWKTVRKVLEFGQMLGVDFVKFQPIFNDGYVELNAAHLMLSPSDSPQLLDIGRRLSTIEHPKTNPSGFWKNIADLAAGKELSSKSCGLGPWHSIAVRNNLSVCYWLGNVSFGNTSSKLENESALVIKRSFEVAKLKCKVGFHCFCTQDLSHIWENQKIEKEEKLG
jgi:MoaA/NifB/PqqE/SkfB family radical SAM enzyme